MGTVNDALQGFNVIPPSDTNRFATEADLAGVGTGTVTSVTATAPVVITGTPTTTPNVTLDLGAGGSLGVSGGKLQREALTGDVTASADSNTTAIAAGVIVDADVSASAAIARSKLAAGTAHAAVVNDSSGVMAGVAPGASGTVFTSDGTDWTAAQPTGQPIQRSYLSDGVIANLYLYAPHCTATGTGTGAGKGNMRAVPITFGRDGTVNTLGVNMAASVANSVGRVGLYLAGSDGYPSTLIGESGALTLSGTTGPKLGTSLGLAVRASQSYWLAFLGGTAAPNLVTVSTSAEPIGVSAMSGSGTVTQVQGITVAQAYGAMPGTFPASAGAITTASQLPLMLVGLT